VTPCLPAGSGCLLDRQRVIEEILQRRSFLDRHGHAGLPDAVMAIDRIGRDGYSVRTGLLGRLITIDSVGETLGRFGLTKTHFLSLRLIASNSSVTVFRSCINTKHEADDVQDKVHGF